MESNGFRGCVGHVKEHPINLFDQHPAEAQTEAENDQAALGVVIAKRRGTTDPGQQFVLMTVEDLTKLLAPPTSGASNI